MKGVRLSWVVLQLPISVYITIKRWMVHADATCALMIGTDILSVQVRVVGSLLGILGNCCDNMALF